MTPAQIIAPLASELETFVQPWGHVSVAQDPFNVYEVLTQGPHASLVVVHWAGDQHEASDYRVGIVRATLEIYVGRNRGLHLDKGRMLSEADPFDGEPALYTTVSDIRDFVRTFNFSAAPDVEAERVDDYAHYLGADPVPMPDGIPLAAYRIRFGLYHSLPTVALSTHTT